MEGKIVRIVPRSSLTTEQMWQIVRRMCDDCFAEATCAYFKDTSTEFVAFGFCEKCPFSIMPSGTIEAYPVHEYLAWAYICEMSDLVRVLSEQAEHAEELLMDKLLVIQEEGKTKMLRFAGLVPHNAPFPIPEHVEGIPLRFPQLPCILHNDDYWMYKLPMALVYNTYPSCTKK